MMNYHRPVLLKESILGLAIKPDGTYVDVTLGGGGHSNEILKRLQKGRLLSFDMDEDAIKNVPTDSRIIFINHNFRFLQNFLRYYKIDEVDGIIGDLGVSSHHFDSAERGFTFQQEGPLDMRMNTYAKHTAADIINNSSQEELTEIFIRYGELKNAKSLAAAIIKFREHTPLTVNFQLIEAIKPFLPINMVNQYLAKVFQALRIKVNNELENLKELLVQSCQFLKPGGRLVIISYHSLEDRLVKNFIRSGNFGGKVTKDIYGNYSVPFLAINKKVIVPSDEEIEQNSRARSARLRIAERI